MPTKIVDVKEAQNQLAELVAQAAAGMEIVLTDGVALRRRDLALLRRYHPRPGGGSLFRTVFADPARWHSREDTP